MLGAPLLDGEDPQLAPAAVDRLLVGAVRVLQGDLPVVRTVGDELPVPFEAGPLVEAMWWHPAYDDDPEHAYLRDLVSRATELAVGGAGATVDVGDALLSRT